MYKIIVVDDEPTALNHVCMILEKKCPIYEVAGTAENGKEALALIKEKQPDIVITDVKMPIMDGIELVARIQAEYPEVLTVIISGYQEFDYAKKAMKSGVCDYLLKPLKPSDLKQLMDTLEVRLNTLYYKKRNQLMRMMCNETELMNKECVKRYFPSGKYYSAIIRINGLPKRFSRNTGIEIFSMEEEKVYIYGRDERESLYLMPEELLFGNSFITVMKKIYTKMKDEDTYVTAIIYPESFEIENFPGIIRLLYRQLDEAIIIGKSQFLDKYKEHTSYEKGEEEKKQFEYMEYLIRYKETGKVQEELTKLFASWEKSEYGQLYVESQIRYIFQLIQNAYMPQYHLLDTEFLLDDAFCYVSSMEILKETVLALVSQYIPTLEQEKIDDKLQLFQSIKSYLKGHMDEYITLGSICRKFGVSQTLLSKMFRTYEETSFSNYLTGIRIEKAKEIMKHDPDIYIKDVAERVGYKDQFYFSRIFHSIVGVCPSEYGEEKVAN